MSATQLQEFIHGVVVGRLFLSTQVRDRRELPLVFRPIALGAFAGWSRRRRQRVGVLYGDMSVARPETANGHPVFDKVGVVHKDD